MSFFAQFREVQAGQRPSASQYNQLLRLVKQIASSLMANGMFSPGTGFVTRRGLTGSPGSVIRLAKAQESAQGNKYISVRLLDADGNETGDAFDAAGLAADASSVIALDDAVPLIVSGDIIEVFKANDGQWYIVGLFCENTAAGDEIIAVKTTESATANDHITCQLATWNSGTSSWDAEGEEFEVYALFVNASNFTALNAAVPRIVSGEVLMAKPFNGRHFFLTQFDGDEDCECYSSP